MFRGTYIHTIDSKGRTSVPARFRSKLKIKKSEPLILTKGWQKSLMLWPPEAWLEFEKNLAARSIFDPIVQKLKQVYVAPSMECSFDKQGRILIPPPLRDYATLKKEVYWVGHINVIHIWSKEQYDIANQIAYEDLEAINKEAAALGL